MQTFLPSPNYVTTASQLDQKRLINQCCNESVRLIEGKWPNHPAAKMWADYKYSLALYNVALAAEWIFRFTMDDKPVDDACKWREYWEKQVTAQRELGNGNMHIVWIEKAVVTRCHSAF